MHKASKYKSLLETGIVLLIGILLSSVLFERHPIHAELHWQSMLPKPNPHFVRSSTGGRIYCGSQQSSVWLDVPRGFTTEGGAEIHCAPTGSLSQWIGTSGAWDDRGYLVNLYPRVPLIGSLRLVFEMDPAKTGDIRSGCFITRYYDPETSQWRTLSTVYDTGNLRVYAEISEYPPVSEYPAYEDRFLIALFVRSEAEPTPTPALHSTATPVPPPTPSPMLTFSPTPSPAPTSSPPPPPSPSPTLTTTSPTPFPVPTEAIMPESRPLDKALLVLVLVLVVIVFVLFVIVIFLIRGQRGLKRD